jgi:hypothetical protein
LLPWALITAVLLAVSFAAVTALYQAAASQGRVAICLGATGTVDAESSARCGWAPTSLSGFASRP